MVETHEREETVGSGTSKSSEAHYMGVGRLCRRGGSVGDSAEPLKT